MSIRVLIPNPKMGINNPIPRSLKSETKYVHLFASCWSSTNLMDAGKKTEIVLWSVSIVDRTCVAKSNVLTII